MFLSFIIILLAKCCLNCAIWAWQNASSSKLNRWLWMLPTPSLEDAFWVCFFFLFCMRTPSCKAMSCLPRNLRREYSIQSLPCYTKIKCVDITDIMSMISFICCLVIWYMLLSQIYFKMFLLNITVVMRPWAWGSMRRNSLRKKFTKMASIISK